MQDLWVVDDSQVQIQVDSLLLLPNIEYVAIRATGDVGYKWSAGVRQSERVMSKESPLNFSSSDGETKLGDLLVVASLDKVYSYLIGEISIILISNAAKTSIVSIFILIMFYYSVTRHLNAVSAFVSHFDVQRPNVSPLRLQRAGHPDDRHDELDIVASAINEMVSGLTKSYQALQLRNQAIEASGNVIVIFDVQKENNPIVYANSAIESVTGYTVAEAMGRNAFFLIGEDRRQPDFDDILAAVDGRKPVRARLRVYHKDGTRLLANTELSPVLDDSGHVTHFLSIYEDVTEKVHVEEQLRQAQKLEAVGQLTGSIVHDFNNILTVLKCNLDLMGIEKSPDKRRQRLLDGSGEAVELGAKLCNRLLTFSRKQPTNPRLVDLNSVVVGLKDLLQHSVGSDIGIDLALANERLSVVVDSGHLENALLNLVINSKDALPGGGTITIGTGLEQFGGNSGTQSPGVAAGDYAFLYVRDAGTGMPLDVQERAFEPFFTTKDVGKGTGLGLSTVYGLAQQAGGMVDIDSVQGGGTTVKIYLPEVGEDTT